MPDKTKKHNKCQTGKMTLEQKIIKIFKQNLFIKIFIIISSQFSNKKNTKKTNKYSVIKS